MPWNVLHFLFSSRTVPPPHPLGLGIYFGLCKSHMFSLMKSSENFASRLLLICPLGRLVSLWSAQGREVGAVCCQFRSGVPIDWGQASAPSTPHPWLPLGTLNPNPPLSSKSSSLPSSPWPVPWLRVHDTISLFQTMRIWNAWLWNYFTHAYVCETYSVYTRARLYPQRASSPLKILKPQTNKYDIIRY